MTRRFFNWLGKHQVVAISSLNAGLILCLAILAGIASSRRSHPQAWALDSAETTRPDKEIPRATAGRELPQKYPVAIANPATAKNPAFPGDVSEEPPRTPPAEIDIPDLPAPPPAPAPRETTAPGSPAKDLHQQAEVATKPFVARPAEKPGFPARSEAPGRDVRALRARPVPPIRRGRILRPRQ